MYTEQLASTGTRLDDLKAEIAEISVKPSMT
jgi:hypothetical protein